MDEYDIPKRVPPPPARTQNPPSYPPGYPQSHPPGYPPGYPPAYPPPHPSGYGPPFPYPPPGQSAHPATGPSPSLTVSPPAPARAGSRRPTPSARLLRGTLGGALTALGLLAASLALAAFVLSTLVLDPARPGEVLKAVLTTQAGRSIATEALATAIRTSAPGTSAAQANKDAAAIVASPALASGLGSSKSQVSDALLAQLAQVDPAAATAVSKLPASTGSPLSALPNGLVSDGRKAHSALRTSEIALSLAAVALVGIALLLGPARDRILIRVGRWAIAASVIQLLIWFGLPRLLGHFTDSWAQVGAATLRAGGTGLLTVFWLLAGLGAVALIIGHAGRFLVPQR